MLEVRKQELSVRNSLHSVAQDILDSNVPSWAHPSLKSAPMNSYVFAHLLSQLFARPPLRGKHTSYTDYKDSDIRNVLKSVAGRSLVSSFLGHVAKLYGCHRSELTEPRNEIFFHPWVETYGATLSYSVRSKQVYVQEFLDWLSTFSLFRDIESRDLNLRHVKDTHVRAYFRRLSLQVSAGHMAQNTAHHRTLAVCQFFKWCRRQYGIRLGNKLSAIPSKLRSPIEEYWLPTALEARRLFSRVLMLSETPVSDFCIIGLLYSNGLRPNELCNIRWEDVDLHRRILTITEKGNSRRTIALSKTIVEGLSGLPRCGSYVFGDRAGKKLPYKYLSLLMFTYGTLSGWSIEHCKPYVWRHAFVTGMLEKFGDYHLVRRLARHRTVQVTLEYTHIKTKRLTTAAQVVSDKSDDWEV